MPIEPASLHVEGVASGALNLAAKLAVLLVNKGLLTRAELSALVSEAATSDPKVQAAIRSVLPF